MHSTLHLYGCFQCSFRFACAVLCSVSLYDLYYWFIFQLTLSVFFLSLFFPLDAQMRCSWASCTCWRALVFSEHEMFVCVCAFFCCPLPVLVHFILPTKLKSWTVATAHQPPSLSVYYYLVSIQRVEKTLVEIRVYFNETLVYEWFDITSTQTIQMYDSIIADEWGNVFKDVLQLNRCADECVAIQAISWVFILPFSNEYTPFIAHFLSIHFTHTRTFHRVSYTCATIL